MAIQKPEWFKMDPAKFFSDAQVDAMSTLEIGACFRLLGRQWIDGHIPDDLRLLARLCRLDSPSMTEAWVTLCPFFPVVEPGKRANRFMWMEREKVIAALDRKSDAGTRAARKRWDEVRKRCDATPITKPNGSPIPEPIQDQTRADQTREENTFPQTAFADDRAAFDSKSVKPTDAQLDQLYKLYPRKRDKLDAKKSIRKAVGVVIAGDPDHPAMPLDEALDYLAARITLYARCVQGCDPDYIPYPASWFNAGSFWDDERDWSKQNGTTNGNGAAKLPAGYISASERIRQERGARAEGAQ